MLSPAIGPARSSLDFRQSYRLERGAKPTVSLSYIRRLYASPAPLPLLHRGIVPQQRANLP